MEGKIAAQTPTNAFRIAHDIRQVSQQSLQLSFALDALPPMPQSEVLMSYPLRQFFSALKHFSAALEHLAAQVAALPSHREYEQLIDQQRDEILYLQELLQQALTEKESDSLAMEG